MDASHATKTNGSEPKTQITTTTLDGSEIRRSPVDMINNSFFEQGFIHVVQDFFVSTRIDDK